MIPLLRKADSPIEVIVLGRVQINFLLFVTSSCENAPSPISTTPSGITSVLFVKLFSKNAFLPIFVSLPLLPKRNSYSGILPSLLGTIFSPISVILLPKVNCFN